MPSLKSTRVSGRVSGSTSIFSAKLCPHRLQNLACESVTGAPHFGQRRPSTAVGAGRPSFISVDKFRMEYQKVVDGELRPFELMKRLGMSKPTFYRYVRKIKM